MIISLVDAVLKTLDDAITPAANWVLELLDVKDDLQQITGEEITTDMIGSFQETVARPYVSHLKENNQVHSNPMTLCQHWRYSIHGKFQVLILSNCLHMVRSQIEVLLDYYGKNKPVLTVSGEETEKTALISSEVETEWVTFRNLLAKKPKEGMTSQLELITN